MELVHIPREEPPKPGASLPSSRWYSPVDIKYETKVPQLNTRLARIWNTYKQGTTYVADERQKFHNTNIQSIHKTGRLLWIEQLSTFGNAALGLALGTLVLGQTVLGLRWAVKWIGRKMVEPEEGEEKLQERVHARAWRRQEYER